MFSWSGKDMVNSTEKQNNKSSGRLMLYLKPERGWALFQRRQIKTYLYIDAHSFYFSDRAAVNCVGKRVYSF